MEGVSLLSVKLSVLRELNHFQGELQTDEFPRLSNSRNLDYFRIAGILIWRGFTFVQKYTRFLEFSHSEHNSNRGNFEIKGVSFLSKILPLFLEFLKSRLFQNRGNFTLGEFHSSR